MVVLSELGLSTFTDLWETASSFTPNRSREEENHKRLKNSTENLNGRRVGVEQNAAGSGWKERVSRN